MSSIREIVFSVENNPKVPIKIDDSNLPVENPRATVEEFEVYVALGILDGKKGAYLVAKKWYGKAVPEGAIVYYKYGTGSRKHTYHKYRAFFIVKNVGKKKVLLKDMKGDVDVEIEVFNLEPLKPLDDEKLAEMEAEIMNRGWLPSNYQPVRTLYYYWIKKGSESEKCAEKRSTPVLINGFLVISRLPSKALLDASIPEIFKDVKIGRKEIKLTMGYFYNKLGTLSRKFYNQILPEYAVNAGFGYIVPKDKVAEFLREVDLLKKEYAVFEKQLKQFLLEGRIPPEVEANKRAKVDRKYLDIVMEFLRRHGKDEEVRRKIESLSIADRLRINLLPFSVDMSILEEYVDEKVRRRIEEEIYSVRREIVDAVRKQLEEKARAILGRLEKYAEAKLTKEVLEGMRRSVEEIRKMAEEFGVESESLRVLEGLMQLQDDELVRKVAELKASGRVKALLEMVM